MTIYIRSEHPTGRASQTLPPWACSSGRRGQANAIVPMQHTRLSEAGIVSTNAKLLGQGPRNTLLSAGDQRADDGKHQKDKGAR